jgi:hypothetical protein
MNDWSFSSSPLLSILWPFFCFVEGEVDEEEEETEEEANVGSLLIMSPLPTKARSPLRIFSFPQSSPLQVSLKFSFLPNPEARHQVATRCCPASLDKIARSKGLKARRYAAGAW